MKRQPGASKNEKHLAPPAAEEDSASRPACPHCGLAVGQQGAFCCPGCAAAFQTITALGLGTYYSRRVLDAAARPLRPDAEPRFDLERATVPREDGALTLTLAIDGIQCGACVWLIEHVLAREHGVLQARVNMTTRRLSLAWRGGPEEAPRLVGAVESLGYRLVPFDADALAASRDAAEKALLRALAVAGFAAGNVMLISVGLWAGLDQGMGPATRALLHWISALIAMPSIAYAGMPFFRSALAALRRGRTNMDVPVSVGVVLVTGLSLAETIGGGRHTYFDSAVTLLFFLLVGRLLDHRARYRARATAEQLLVLRAADLQLLQPDGTARRVRAEAVSLGDRVLVGMGERIGADGVIVHGETQLDASLVTGESTPAKAGTGTQVFAGTLNLGPAIILRVSACGDRTLLAECARLIEAAEQRRGKIVVLADKIARAYTPVVHLAALLTFLFWRFAAGAALAPSLLTACSVLIVTCPCALALAVPAVQVIVTGRLFRQGILLKSPTALERLATVDVVAFDKTGTLTEPALAAANPLALSPENLAQARSLAASSRHPLARALLRVGTAPVVVACGAQERPGEGIEADGYRLGSAAFCGAQAAEPAGPELYFAAPGLSPCRFTFTETVRPDVEAVLRLLRRLHIPPVLLSGDRAAPVAALAARLGIAQFHAECTPLDKLARIESLRAQGRRVLMVGDGLNDGPCLAAATVSAAPASGADISQTVADVVFQGASLMPVATVLRAARQARAAMRQNIGIALVYNAVMVPLAVSGRVTPWLAAVAMSSSSLLVMANSFRSGR